jgi:hypothetical protein
MPDLTFADTHAILTSGQTTFKAAGIIRGTVSTPSGPPPIGQVPWYEKAFKIQFFLLLLALSVGGPIMAVSRPLVVPRFPWLPLVLKIGMTTIAPMGGGFVAIMLHRHLLCLFGRGPHVEWVMGPPSRINCVMLIVAGLVAVGIALEHGGFAPVTLTLWALRSGFSSA